MSFVHNSIDGRNAFAVVDMFLSFPSTKLSGIAENTFDNFGWGQEVVRLPPPSGFIPSLVESGQPPVVESEEPPSDSAEKDAQVAQQQQIVCHCLLRGQFRPFAHDLWSFRSHGCIP